MPDNGLSDLSDEELEAERVKLGRGDLTHRRIYLPIIHAEESRRAAVRAQKAAADAKAQADTMEGIARTTLKVAVWTLIASVIGIVVSLVT